MFQSSILDYLKVQVHMSYDRYTMYNVFMHCTLPVPVTSTNHNISDTTMPKLPNIFTTVTI